MSDEIPKCNGIKHKRKNKNQRPKRQKTDFIDDQFESTKLTDVNRDCLERIFCHLSLDDLLTIAHANKQLKPAADLTEENSVYIKDVHNSLRLLRCFGHLITKLSVGHQNYHEYLIPYVVDYSADSLRTVEFVKGKQIFDYLTKPFAKAEMVNFTGCLNLQLERLNEYFPKMRRLTLDDFELSASIMGIELNFPHLEHLRLNVNRNDVTHFLRSNSKLRSLRVLWGYNPDAFKNATKCLQQLERLEVIYCDSKCLQSDKSIQLTNLKSLLIDLLDLYSRKVWNPRHKIPFLCEKLEELILNVDNFRVSDQLIEFIVKHPTIVKLCIKSSYVGQMFGGERMMNIARTLTALRDVDFGTFLISSDEVVRFVGTCADLNWFRFIALNYFEIEVLRTQVNGRWNIEMFQYKQDLCLVKMEREN